MYINNAYEVLVLILATTLAVFLILAIIAAVKLNQILDQVKVITDKTERFIDKAETVGEFISSLTVPTLLGTIIGSVGETMKKRKGKRED